jgi:hypothetical protein
MPYSIAQVKNDISAIMHGTTLNQIQSLDSLIDRAGRKLVNDIDPIETERKITIATPLYDKVYDYPAPTDLKDDRIIDIFPQVHRKLRDMFFQVYNEEFDLYKDYTVGFGNWTIEYDTALKYIRIAKKLPSPLLINPATTITGTGTWTEGGDATNLANDNIQYVYGNSSLKFDLSNGGTSGYLENSTFQPVNLTNIKNQGVLFIYVYIPNPTDISTIELRWGSSSSDYYTQSVSANFFGNAYEVGWNLLKFDWVGSTEVGTPDSDAISYVRATVNYNGTPQYSVRLNSITTQLGTIYLMKYYSKYIFRDAITGAFKENVTSDSDLINLDTTSYNMFFNLCAYFVFQQQKSSGGEYDADFFLQEYEKEKSRYVAKIRSQVIKPQSKYYKMPPKGGSTTRKII